LREAAFYYRWLAGPDKADGQFNFGQCLEHGTGISINFVERAGYYRLYADQGNTGGLFADGCCIELGISIDFVETSGYYKLCADQGDHHGQLHYGLCLELGNHISTGATDNIPAGSGPTRFEDDQILQQ
jgi:TPR repeat protein